MSAFIEARGLTFRAGGRALVDGVDLALAPGRVAVVVGPNGAGKSTLLRLLTGELRPSGGSVTYDGVAAGAIPGWRLAGKRAVLAQAMHLAFPFAVHEVVRVGIDGVGRGLGPARRRAIVAASLDAAEVAHLAARPFQHLSGGERQRVRFARALAQLDAASAAEPRRALFLDEPIAGLDPRHQLAVMDMAARAASRGVAVLAILHDLTLAAGYADDLVVLDEGRIAAAGRPADILAGTLLSRVFQVELRIERDAADGTALITPRRRARATAPPGPA